MTHLPTTQADVFGTAVETVIHGALHGVGDTGAGDFIAALNLILATRENPALQRAVLARLGSAVLREATRRVRADSAAAEAIDRAGRLQ